MTFSSYECIGIGLIFYYRVVIFSIPYRLRSSQIEVLVFFFVRTRVFLYLFKG